MLEKIREFCAMLGDKIGLSANLVMWGGLGIIVLLLFLAIFIPVMICKKRKKKMARAIAEHETKRVVKPVFEEKVDEQPVNTVNTVNTADEEKPTAIKQPVIEEPSSEQVEVKEEFATEQEKGAEEQKEVVKEKKTTKKSAPVKKETKKDADKPVKKLNGKWSVEIKTANEYVAKLSASNGAVMLYSEPYTTEDGARNGIATIIKGIENGSMVLYQDKNSNYYFKIKSATNRLLCVGEIYKSKEQCLKAFESVKRIASSSMISSDLVEGARYIEYIPKEINVEGKKIIKGKWKVENTEEGKFVARLYASNGQLMLATEQVANKKTALNAIESVKKNALEANFVIDRDKSNRYYYKLRNAQRSIICIGEAYVSLDSCVSAIESVRRLVSVSPLVEE